MSAIFVVAPATPSVAPYLQRRAIRPECMRDQPEIQINPSHARPEEAAWKIKQEGTFEKRIEGEIRGEAYKEIFRQIQENDLILNRFQAWDDLLVFMHKGDSSDPDKNLVLRAIFKAHRLDQSPKWRTILLAIFWPALESIHWQKRRWDADAEDRWQNIVWTFLKVVCRIDPNRRPDRLVQKVFNDTVHCLWDEYEPRWQQSKVELSVDINDLNDLAVGEKDIDLTSIDLRLQQEAEIRRLADHYDRGQLTEKEFLILVGTKVYGKSIGEYAREAGLNYQAAKKRKQRAETSIRSIKPTK